jgi:hypothetical protein
MTLSKNDISLSLNDFSEKKIFKTIFSNILFSSAVLLIIILFIFKVNNCHIISTFVYGYVFILGFNLIGTYYIKKEFSSKEKLGLNEDFKTLMENAKENPVLLYAKRGSNEGHSTETSDSIDTKRQGVDYNKKEIDELEELNDFF